MQRCGPLNGGFDDERVDKAVGALVYRRWQRHRTRMTVSTLILTFNEEANLQACLDALRWCDDIVVVDSGSTDRTLEVARRYGVRVLTRPFDNFANQRNYGLEHGGFKHEWVLHLDADEVVTPAFVAALEQLDADEDIYAYEVPSKTMFFGKWLRHAGMWPSYQVRLGRVKQLRFVQVGHGQREDLPRERLGVFPEAYLHFSFSHGLTAWLEKHLRYASDEVDALVDRKTNPPSASERRGGVMGSRRAIKARVSGLPLTLRPFLKFFYVYVLRCGFLDGRRGFAYAFMLAVYEGMIAVIGLDRLRKLEDSEPASPEALQLGPSATSFTKESS